MIQNPKIQFLHPRAVRISYSADRPWLKEVLLPRPALDAKQADFRIEEDKGALRAFAPSGETFFCQLYPPEMDVCHRQFGLDLDIPKTSVSIAARQIQQGIGLRLETLPDEVFYGWGERFDAFSRREGVVQARIRDAIAMIQQSGATYSALPFFLSSRGYGLILLNSHPARWKMDPQGGQMIIEADGPGADYILIYGPEFKDITSTYTALMGRPPLPPMWAFGLWVTTYPQGPQKTVLEQVRQHRQRAIPLDAVILDYHWEDRFHNFKWRESLFPDPAGLIAALKTEGVHLGLILTPFVNHRNRPLQKWLLNRLAHNVPPGMEQTDERALPEYAEGLARGYFAHPNARWWFGAGGMMDFTHPAAVEWWNDRLNRLYDEGVDFIKNDDGEYLPENAAGAIGINGCEYHNLYGFFYGKALYEGLETHGAGKKRGLIYARSAWLGSQRYPGLFLGDQKPTFEFIRRGLNAALNMSLAGFAYWTADVFGLDGKTTPETHRRFAQWALLSPIARYFYRPPDVDDTRFPWSYGEENEAHFRKYVELRYRLLPYWYALAWEAWQTGIPPVRPLVMEFPRFEAAAEVADQFILGGSLLVAPVMQAGAVSRRVVLPPGAWHDFWTDAIWEGPGEVDYPAPPDRLPLLVRGGTLLATGPAMQCIPAGHRFARLYLHLWPDGGNRPLRTGFALYEDDGESLAYQQGEFSLTEIRAEGLSEADPRRLVVRIGKAAGHFAGQLKTRQVSLVFHHFGMAASLKVNGQDVPTPELPVACPVDAETVIEVKLSGKVN